MISSDYGASGITVPVHLIGMRLYRFFVDYGASAFNWSTFISLFCSFMIFFCHGPLDAGHLAIFDICWRFVQPSPHCRWPA